MVCDNVCVMYENKVIPPLTSAYAMAAAQCQKFCSLDVRPEAIRVKVISINGKRYLCTKQFPKCTNVRFIF